MLQAHTNLLTGVKHEKTNAQKSENFHICFGISIIKLIPLCTGNNIHV